MDKMIDLALFSKRQQEAIITQDKHLRIIACAGSGKTTTVAGKVAYLLDLYSDSIIYTGTLSGAYENI